MKNDVFALKITNLYTLKKQLEENLDIVAVKVKKSLFVRDGEKNIKHFGQTRF
ncbi:MAG: hypothetical protein IPL26_10770 [Leptospiraceae bacterium]|nr:hypothetical protein [Leptospiraceae bacterium]